MSVFASDNSSFLWEMEVKWSKKGSRKFELLRGEGLVEVMKETGSCVYAVSGQ